MRVIIDWLTIFLIIEVIYANWIDYEKNIIICYAITF
jgi:hypothetical protein